MKRYTLIAGVLALVGCLDWSIREGSGDADADVDTDIDADSDTDADGDAEENTDSDIDGEGGHGPCDGVTCSGHGRCFADGGEASCACDEGYHADGLECASDAVDGDADVDADADLDDDEPSFCGDSRCSADESTDTCPEDCRPICGDGVCDEGENTADCPDDCCAGGVLEGDYGVYSALDIEALSGFSVVSGNLHITGCPLTSLTGLECLEEVGGYLTIQANAALENLDALSRLTSVTGVNILANPVLTSLARLDSIEEVEGNLIVFNNAALASLDGLGEITSIGGTLHIQANGTLTNLDGLSGLRTLSGDLHITRNEVLPTCAAEALSDRLRAAGWEGDADISDNDDSGTCD